MSTAAVILAAGASSRFGSPKQAARIGGRTMLELIAEVAREAELAPVIAVVPPGVPVPAFVVPDVNPDAEAGISHSLRLGLAAVPIEAGAAVVLLGDEPGLTVQAIRAVLGATGDVVATRAGDRLGPPVLLRRHRFGLADAAVGDGGLGPILRRLPGLTVIAMDTPLADVDTPADLSAWPDGG
jgi:molybdenum cofactor cytidylyltransferase